MGLATLPTVGGSLGPTKSDRPFQTPDPIYDIAAAEWQAAAQALEDVCAEVGLADGSTSGSVLERLDTLESASGVAAHAASHATGGSDAITPVSIGAADAADLTAAEGDITTNASAITAMGLRVDDLESLPVWVHTRSADGASLALTQASHAGYLIFINADTGDVSVELDDNEFNTGAKCAVFVYGGNDAIFTGTGTMTISARGSALTVTTSQAYAELLCTGPEIAFLYGHDGDLVADITMLEGRATALEFPTVTADQTTATRTISDSDQGTIIPVSAASNAVAITIPDSVTDGFSCAFDVEDTTNAVTITLDEYATVLLHGPGTNVSGVVTVDADNTMVTVARVGDRAHVFAAATDATSFP